MAHSASARSHADDDATRSSRRTRRRIAATSFLLVLGTACTFQTQEFDDEPRDVYRPQSGLPRVKIQGRLITNASVLEDRPAEGLKDEARTLIPAGRIEFATNGSRTAGVGFEVDRVRTDSEQFGTNNRLEWTQGFGYGWSTHLWADDRIRFTWRAGANIGAGDSIPGSATPDTRFAWAYGGPRIEIEPEVLVLRGDDWHLSAFARGTASGYLAHIENSTANELTVGRLLGAETGLRLRAGPVELGCGYLWRDFETEGTGSDDTFFGSDDLPETRLDIEGVSVTAAIRF